ncbi:hypothetical protein E0Z10_g4828 [Xylaria hypoxylon]|uniref:Extracellular membrane protein CFEM domain-containing protein n=1 Tax=Xylaria hypoxylon TaxID=37992 RepID=A0A4Z0Z5P3_9PEZI|nr:hypothetical protein E0Z10_g4828 [Xylaria hypoxylon]
MQFITITTIFGMLLASAPALATPVENVAPRQVSVGTCGSQFGAPITSFPIGEACSGDGFACDPTCTDIIQCANGVFVLIASCGSDICAGNHNGGAPKEDSVSPLSSLPTPNTSNWETEILEASSKMRFNGGALLGGDLDLEGVLLDQHPELN